MALVWPGTEPLGERESRDQGLVESAAARPFYTVFGKDAYPTIIEKAVALFHSLISNHAFANGNKRTAVIALDHFLIANDHCLLLGNDEMYKVAEATASYKKRGLSQDQSLAEITAALDGFVVPLPLAEKAVGQDEGMLPILQRFRDMRDWVRAYADVSEVASE